MKDVGEPGLIISNGASAHHFSLRPSDARKIQQADLIFRVGPNLETFLDKPLQSLADKATVISLANTDSLHKIPVRNRHHHEGHGESTHSEAAADCQPQASCDDPHYWLDPENAKLWVGTILSALLETDPENAAIYRRNADELVSDIEQLITELTATWKEVETQHYLVLHDSLQYFEQRFGLGQGVAVMQSDERRPGAQHMKSLRHTIEHEQIDCVFSEPQVDGRLLQALISDLPLTAGQVDPLGTMLQPGPQMYSELIKTLSNDLLACMAGR